MKFGTHGDFCQGRTLDEAAANACNELGVVWKSTPRGNRWHRLDVGPNRSDKGDASIKYFDDDQGGCVKNWKTDEQCSFFVADDKYTSLSEAEKAKRKNKHDEQRRQTEAEFEEMRRKAADLANKIWLVASVVEATHPYIAKKCVKNTPEIKELSIKKVEELLGYRPNTEGNPLSGRILVIPLKDINGNISSVQFIDENGTKYFLYNGRKAGCYFEMPGNNATVHICEGVATALSVAEAFPEQTVISAFDAGNMLSVASVMRRKHPNASIILCSDDDLKRVNKRTGNPENIGRVEAERAARAVNGRVAIPDFGNAKRPDNASDFNDLHQLCGLDAVRRSVEEAAAPKPEGKAAAERKSIADQLVEIACQAVLFHTASDNDDVYADLTICGHRETHSVRGKSFKKWILSKLYEATGRSANNEALSNALNTIEAKAKYGGHTQEVFVRVAEHSGKFYIDLCAPTWSAVEIDADGWRIVAEPPVRFRRASGMMALPMPVAGGSIDDLRDFLNVRTDNDFVLAVAWALAALSPRGPYPVLIVQGEQGTAKSTFSELLRSIVDPNDTPLRSIPKNEHDLFIAAVNAQIIAIDNVSGLPSWLSDTLCRLATGGGFSVRQLYTDGEEKRFAAKRPIVLNGIEDIATRGDLADRAIMLALQPISETDRKRSQVLMAEFEAKLPGILGALLDGISHGLKMLPNIELKSLPRMADFAFWATACETQFWPRGTFEAAYSGNRNEAVSALLDGDPVASAIRSLLDNWRNGAWQGTASELLLQLRALTSDETRRERTFPANARALSGHITRLAPALRKIGIEVRNTRTASSKLISIKNSTNSDDDDASNDATMTQNDAKPNGEKPLHTNENDADTANDAKKHTFWHGTQENDREEDAATAKSAEQPPKPDSEKPASARKSMRIKIPLENFGADHEDVSIPRDDLDEWVRQFDGHPAREEFSV